MIQPRKTITSRIARAVKTIPFVKCAVAARRKAILRHALSLYRKDKFLSVAAYKQAGLFFITSSAFAMSVHSNMNETSLLVKYGKPFTAFVGMLYPIMNTYFGSRELSRRKEIFMMKLKINRAKKSR
jgi:hypothetical protein